VWSGHSCPLPLVLVLFLDLPDCNSNFEQCAKRWADETSAPTQAYLACNDSMYRFRFAIRCCTNSSWPPPIFQKTGPHTGIS
jgi:hypothetical protein